MAILKRADTADKNLRSTSAQKEISTVYGENAKIESRNVSVADIHSINQDGEALLLQDKAGKKAKRTGRASRMRNEASLVNFESGVRQPQG